MSDFKHRMIRKLLRDDEPPLSRNKNFETFEDPTVLEARRISRHLYSIEKQCLELCVDELKDFRVEFEDGKVTISWRIETDERKASRQSYLSSEEWELLCENPGFLAKIRSFKEIFS